MKTIDIFLRTYENDVKWLQYSLKSIAKYVTGHRNIIICIPENQRGLLNHLTSEKITTCPIYSDDYLGQQNSKLLAHTYSDADFILYTDSDCIFDEPINLQDLIKENKPQILYTHYSKVGDGICWKAITEKCLGIPVEYEFMRRHGLVYHRETLVNLQNHFKGELEKYIFSQPYREFSEFNVLGAFAFNYEKEKYNFVNTDNWEYTKPIVKQYHGWTEFELMKKDFKDL